MKKNVVRMFAVVAAVMFMSLTVLELNAHARAGGSRSSGSRGARSYSRPMSPSAPQAQPRQQYNPSPSPMQQPAAGGGFLRSMAGGIMGGMLGGMLFRGLAGAGGMGGGMGSGIGLFEIILLAGGAYLLYRFIKNKRTNSAPLPYGQGYQGGTVTPIFGAPQEVQPAADDVERGIAQIRQMDPSFDEHRFNDLAMDIFFKIQGAWMNRDLAPASALLTEEMRQIFQADVDRMVRDKQINRLENIAVRNVEVVEAWQESGQDYVTALFLANLLDYTTDDVTGAVVSGSKTEPVKFEEFWTFTRPVGNNAWRLSAISQK